MSQGKGNEDPFIELMLLIFVVAVMGWAIWYFGKEYILLGLKWFRWVELNIIYFLTGDESVKRVLDWLYVATPSREEGVSETTMRLRLFTADMGALVATKVNEFFRWLAVPIIFGLGLYAGVFSPKVGFKTRYDLEGLMRQQAKVWPVIKPILSFNPAQHAARKLGGPVPAKLPTFAEALSPEEWVAYHRIAVQGNLPDRELTRRALTQQLGPRWQGPHKLPMYMMGLYAAFALQGMQKRDEALKLLNDLSECWTLERGIQISDEIETFIRAVVADADLGG
ncbi:MAG: hypothetical protein EBZ69_05970, partial [Alphaproteobacteria bacterium]|nr:hypothetical protein [Alphaproteobacteria bacterium]